MTPDERPFEMTYLPIQLRRDFTNLLPEAITGTTEEKERNFLTRALAAFAIYKLANCTLAEAANSIVDGGNDGGIDAIYYSPLSNILWIVQSKFMNNGRGEPVLGDVSKFKNGLEDLMQGNFDAFRANTAWAACLPQIESYIQNAGTLVRAILVYSGINRVSDDRIRLFEDLRRRFSSSDDYFAYATYNLTSIHEWVIDQDEDNNVGEVQLEILFPGWTRSPYETIYGMVRIKDIAKLYQEHKSKLVAANIRRYKGNTEVNVRIAKTCSEEPHHFFYLNNGITAYCERLEVNNLDRGNADRKRITARGFAVINGAQTLGSVQVIQTSEIDASTEGYVFLKIISLERCENDSLFARRITQSTNFQNQIGSRDFVSLDEAQERIAENLQLANIQYHYKDGEDVPPPDAENFTLDEATSALASLEQENSCDLCSRILANRNSLWSFEEVYPNDPIIKTRYHRLFRPDRSSRTVWRAVQSHRLVVRQMQADGRSSSGVRKTFFENARALVSNIVFLKLRPEQGDELSLGSEEESAIRAKAIEVAEILWESCETLGYVSRRTDVSVNDLYESPRHFRSVFCSASDCQRLRNATLARLS